MQTPAPIAPLIALVLAVSVPACFAGPALPLAKVKSFAFGGVGVAGTTSDGGRLFRVMLAQHDALAQFHAVLAMGTPEAKLYALCGVRILDKAAFDTASAALVKENLTVETCAGCMIYRQPAAGVVRAIARGQYDRHWIKK